MAITRTPIVDDSGTGTDGTVLNNSWKQQFYDQIDAALVGGGGQQPQYAGGGGELAMAAGVTVLPVSNAAAIVITGIGVTGGVVNGQRLIVHNLGPSTVRLAHEDATATAATRIAYPVCPRGQILGVGGAVQLIYDSVAARWRMFLIMSGQAIAVPYSAANFGASVGTWTVDALDQAVNQYSQEGAWLFWQFRIVGSSLSNPSVLRVTLPNGFSATAGQGHYFVPIWVQDAGASPQWGILNPGAPTLQQVQMFSTVGVNNFGVSTNATEVNATVRIQIS